MGPPQTFPAKHNCNLHITIEDRELFHTPLSYNQMVAAQQPIWRTRQSGTVSQTLKTKGLTPLALKLLRAVAKQ
jgi:hypothetical protein